MGKLVKTIVTVLFLVVIAGLLFVRFALPNVGEPEYLKVDATPERIARGAYLANSVAVCVDCHSQRDWSKYSGPLVSGTVGKGGEVFDQSIGFPGRFYAKNITPYGIGKWTDGEILRAITSGVSKDGSALFPVMPHPNYGKMDKEDIISIIAYLRTIKPIENDVPESKVDFPMNFILNTIPKRANFFKIPDSKNTVAYGAYLFNAAACFECHTKKEKGTPVVGMELAGGFEFPLPTGGIVRSANITPDKKTGLGNWTEEQFVSRFKIFGDSTFVPLNVKKGDGNTAMPWTMYGKMKTEDLKAIYAYIRTVKPIENKVVKFSK
jgi:mono/diheme cytochrome c family protein